MKTSFVFFVALVISFPVFTQPSVRELDRYMRSMAEKRFTPVPEALLADEKNHEKQFAVIEPYFRDTLELIRSQAFYIAGKIGEKSSDETLRKKLVQYMVNAIKDKSPGVSGNASQALAQFKKSDFTIANQELIGQYIMPGTAHVERVIKLAGYLELHNYKSRVIVLANSTQSFEVKFAARLALARMSDQSAISYVAQKFSRAKVDDGFVINMLPDLIYTRQREIFKLLETLIHSTEKNCQSADPESGQKIECAYRVAEALAPVIEGFPFSTDPSRVFNTANYPEALASIRTWLLQNPNYKIDRSRF
jgi:hypothetical protein